MKIARTVVTRNLILGIATAGAVFSAGCSHHTSSVPETAASTTPVVSAPVTAPVVAPKSVVVYVLPSKAAHNSAAQDANGLVPVTISNLGANPATSAIDALISGPNSPLPAGTKLIELKIDQSTKIATVDFSSQFQTNFKGGESHEAQAVDSVLQTLGQFPAIHQVQFLVAGHKIDSLGGNVELDEPLPTPQQSAQIASSNANL